MALKTYLSEMKQWAAVIMWSDVMMDPPQRMDEAPTMIVRRTIQGYSPGCDACPPTILGAPALLGAFPHTGNFTHKEDFYSLMPMVMKDKKNRKLAPYMTFLQH